MTCPQNAPEGQAENWQVTPGLRVKLAGDWQVEALIGYGETEDESNTLLRLNNAAPECGAREREPGDGVRSLRPEPHLARGVRDLIGNQIFFAPTKSDFRGYELRANGSLFDAARRRSWGWRPVSNGRTSTWTWARRAASPPRRSRSAHFEREVDSAYVELLRPALRRRQRARRPASPRAERRRALRRLQRRGRYHQHQVRRFLGADDALTFRGSYGTSFRAPLISQIYGNSNNLFNQNYQNPAGGAAAPRHRAVGREPRPRPGRGDHLVGRCRLEADRRSAPELHVFRRRLREPGRGLPVEPRDPRRGKPTSPAPASSCAARRRATACCSCWPQGVRCRSVPSPAAARTTSPCSSTAAARTSACR